MSCNVTWCDFTGDLPDKKDPLSKICEIGIDMATFSYWLDDQLLGAWDLTPFTLPAQLYIAVNGTASTKSTPGTELSEFGRVAITFERISQVQRWNVATVQSSAPSVSTEVASFTFWDSPTLAGGNYWAYANLDTPVSIEDAISWVRNKVLIGMGSPP